MNSAAHPIQRPARILMYTAYFDPEYSGAALQALTLAHALRQRGHHVEFVTNRWTGLAAAGEVDGFRVHRLKPGRWRKHREIRLWANLCRFVWHRRRDFDILHSHGAYYTHAFLGPLGKITGLKSLVKASLAHDDLLDLERPVIGFLHRQMLRRIDAYVGISKDLVREFSAAGLDPARIHHIPNGVDTTHFHPSPTETRSILRTQLGLPADQPVVLYVGVLDPRKNIEWLAQQWVKHDAFGTGALLVAVGPQSREDMNGSLRARLAALAAAHPRRFALHDFASDIRAWYQCVDALILPSLREGLPNVVLEAMACALPCVAARASGSRELIREGETGYTYSHGDVAQMADAVRRCLSDEGIRLGQRAREVTQADYSIDAIADRYQALYAELLN